MSAIVTLPDGGRKEVKNLGWLLRNWQKVERFCFRYNPSPEGVNDGVLVALLKDGGVYETDYASLTLCWNWLDRPVFRGLPFTLLHIPQDKQISWMIGDARWKEINRFPYAEFQDLIELAH